MPGIDDTNMGQADINNIDINACAVKEQKERERLFRENSQPHGEFIIESKTFWWNVVEMENVWRALELQAGGLLLDAGCADGRFFDYLYAKGIRSGFVGLDFAVKPLRVLAKKLYPSILACGDVSLLPFRTAVFDRVVSLGTVQQLPSSTERLRAFRELFRVLKPGGRVVLTVLNRPSWQDLVANGKEGALLSSPELYVYLYDPSELRDVLREAGFEVVGIRAINNLPVRYLKKLGWLGLFIDMAISSFVIRLSMKKGRYILAVCRKR